MDDHSYARHVEWVRELAFDRLDLRDVTLVGQDWGGLIGLRLAAEHPDRFARIVAANTGLPTGDVDMPEVWHRFRTAVQTAETPRHRPLRRLRLPARAVRRRGRAAYDAPFPDENYKAGPRAMPGLVPYRPDDPATEANRAAWQRLAGSTTPLLVAFSDSDPITGGDGADPAPACPARPAASTPRSPAPATSCRRTPAPSSLPPSSTSSPRPPPPRNDASCPGYLPRSDET